MCKIRNFHRFHREYTLTNNIFRMVKSQSNKVTIFIELENRKGVLYNAVLNCTLMAYYTAP